MSDAGRRALRNHIQDFSRVGDQRITFDLWEGRESRDRAESKRQLPFLERLLMKLRIAGFEKMFKGDDDA